MNEEGSVPSFLRMLLKVSGGCKPSCTEMEKSICKMIFSLQFGENVV